MADQNEIKKLLDDPNVTPETKKELVRALAGSGASEDDVKRYAEANGVDVPHDPGVGEHVVGGLLAPVTFGLSVAENVDDEAKRAAFTKEGAEADKIVKKAGEERELGSTQKVLNETGDFPNSNELLDAGAPGLRFFEKFIPVYQKAAPVCGHGGQAPDLKGYIYKNYDEVRDIDLAKFREDAEKINKASGELDNHQNEMTRAWGGLGAWEGEAANAARAYNDKFNGVATGFIEDSQKAPGTITAGATAIQKHVKEFAQHIHDMYAEECGGLTVEKAEEAIRHASGDIFENDGGILDWLSGVPGPLSGAVLGAICGGPLGMLAGLGWGSWISDVRERIINDAKEKLKGLCKEFDSKKEAFDNYCKAVQEGVKADYDTMFQGLEGQIKDKPFGKVGDPPSFTEEQGGDKGGPKKPGGGGGGGGPSGGGGGGPSGGGGGGGMPEIPKPENPLDKDGDGKPDVPGDTDGDGKPDDLDGDGKPDNPKPEENLETVTVKSGDNTIKITEPDSNGHVKMTIDTPKGEPKTYDLDFSKNPEAAKALMSQNGAAAIAGLASSVQGSQAPGAPAPSAPGTPGTAGGGGTPTPGGGGAPGAGEAIPVEVGADGKIHIEQDGVNFTAEVDTKTGEINLTIDDGDGTPDEIGVGFGEDTNDSGTSGGSSGDGSGTTGGGGGDSGDGSGARDLPPLKDDLNLPPDAFPEQVTTMPAQGESLWNPPGSDFAERVGEEVGGRSYIEDNGIMPSLEPQGGGAGVGGRGYIEDNGIMPSLEPQGGGGGGGFAERVGQEVGGRSYIEDNGFMPSVGESRVASDATMTSGASMLGGSSSSGESVLGGSVGGSSGLADSAWSSPAANAADSGSQFGTTTSEAGQPGQATLPTMQDGAQQGQQPTSGATSGGMMGGGMMGGGMAGGAGGAQGGQGGGDIERGASQWRTTGSLFDDDSALSRVQGVLGGDERGGQ